MKPSLPSWPPMQRARDRAARGGNAGTSLTGADASMAALVVAACAGLAIAAWWGAPASAPPDPTADGALGLPRPVDAPVRPAPQPLPAMAHTGPVGASAVQPLAAARAAGPAGGPGFDAATLAPRHPLLADSLQRQVRMQPDAAGGARVLEVAAEGPWARLGLRPGDRLFAVDADPPPPGGHGPMIAATALQRIEVEVLRGSQWLRLALDLAQDPEAAQDHARP